MSETKSFSTLKKEELFDQLLNSINREILGERGKSLQEQGEAFEAGAYGQMTVMSVVASILSHGGSVDHLRGGELPDKLIDFFAETLNNLQAEKEPKSRY